MSDYYLIYLEYDFAEIKRPGKQQFLQARFYSVKKTGSGQSQLTPWLHELFSDLGNFQLFFASPDIVTAFTSPSEIAARAPDITFEFQVASN